MKKSIVFLTAMVLAVSSSAFGLGLWQKAKWVAFQGAAKLTLTGLDKAKAAEAKDKPNLIQAADKAVPALKEQLTAFAREVNDAEVTKQVNEYIIQLDNGLKALKATVVPETAPAAPILPV